MSKLVAAKVSEMTSKLEKIIVSLEHMRNEIMSTIRSGADFDDEDVDVVCLFERISYARDVLCQQTGKDSFTRIHEIDELYNLVLTETRAERKALTDKAIKDLMNTNGMDADKKEV